MTAAAIGTVPAAAVQATGTTRAITMPTHKVGYLIVIGVVSRSTTDISANNGFVEVFEGSTTRPHCALFAKVAASDSETCTVTIGNDDVCTQAMVFAYHRVRAGFEATDILKGTEATATSATFDPPNLSFGATEDAMVLTLAGFAWTNAADAITSGPSGFTTIVNTKSAASTTSVGIYMGWQDNPAVSSLDPGTGANTSRVWRANTFLIPGASYVSEVEDWTGSNGDAWPALWTTSEKNGPATIDIQSNAGRGLTNSGSAYGNSARGIRAWAHTDAIAVVRTLINGAVEALPFLYLRADGTWTATGSDDPSNCYACGVDTTGNTGIVTKYVAGTETLLNSTAFTADPGSTYVHKLIVLGTSIRYRVWDASGAEPTTWQYQTTDPSHISGTHVQLKSLNNSSAGAADIRFDGLQLIDLTGPPRRPPRAVALQAVGRAGNW